MSELTEFSARMERIRIKLLDTMAEFSDLAEDIAMARSCYQKELDYWRRRSRFEVVPEKKRGTAWVQVPEQKRGTAWVQEIERRKID